MVVTGGTAGSHVLATKYNLDGWLQALPDLNHGRRNHACTWYRADEGDLVYLVAGGWDKRGEQPISDTEMLSSDSSLWSLTSPLPYRITGLRAVTLGNIPFLFGEIITFIVSISQQSI